MRHNSLPVTFSCDYEWFTFSCDYEWITFSCDFEWFTFSFDYEWITFSGDDDGGLSDYNIPDHQLYCS